MVTILADAFEADGITYYAEGDGDIITLQVHHPDGRFITHAFRTTQPMEGDRYDIADLALTVKYTDAMIERLRKEKFI